jgi:hypothetical protein
MVFNVDKICQQYFGFLYIVIKEKWCFLNIVELIRRALVDVMLACCLSFVFFECAKFYNTFRSGMILLESFPKFLRLFLNFSYSKI